MKNLIQLHPIARLSRQAFTPIRSHEGELENA